MGSEKSPIEPGPTQDLDVFPSDVSTTLEKEEQPTTGTSGSPSEIAPDDEPEASDAPQYIGGTPLYIAMASLTLVAFLMLLDMSIVATVCGREF